MIGITQKLICFRWGSNPGPSACEADVITTTLRKQLKLVRSFPYFKQGPIKNGAIKMNNTRFRMQQVRVRVNFRRHGNSLGMGWGSPFFCTIN